MMSQWQSEYRRGLLQAGIVAGSLNYPYLSCIDVLSYRGSSEILLLSLAPGFGEWLFIIGLYGMTRELVTTSHPLVPILSELSMPFYLTHQQILVSIASAASWIPYLSE